MLANEEARELNHNYMGTEHLLLGMLHEPQGVAHVAIYNLGLTLEAARDEVKNIIGRGQEPPSGHIPFTPRAKKTLEYSLREALQLGHNYIGTEHLLLGLVREGEGVACQILARSGIGLDQVRYQVIFLLNGHTGAPPPAQAPSRPSAQPARSARRAEVGPDAVLRQVVRLAESEAAALGQGYVGTEHLFLGLVLAEPQEPPSVRDLLDESVTPEVVREKLVTLLGSGGTGRMERRLTDEAGDALDLARCAALRDGADEVTPSHLLLALAGARQSVALRLMTDFRLPEHAAAWMDQHNAEIAVLARGARQALAAVARQHATPASATGG